MRIEIERGFLPSRGFGLWWKCGSLGTIASKRRMTLSLYLALWWVFEFRHDWEPKGDGDGE